MDIEAAGVVVDSRDLQPDALDCLKGLQSLGTNFRAIHDGAAAEQSVGIIVQVVEPFRCRTVKAVGDETMRLDQACRTDEFIRDPPLRRALTNAAVAQDAGIRAIQLVALGRRLQALSFRRRFRIDQIRLGQVVLLEELRLVDDEIANIGKPGSG